VSLSKVASFMATADPSTLVALRAALGLPTSAGNDERTVNKIPYAQVNAWPARVHGCMHCNCLQAGGGSCTGALPSIECLFV
jgi:hypothetical protein